MFVLVMLMCMKKTKKTKLPPADVIPSDHNYSGKGCKESDCSSNKSDMKINRENEYLETCSANDLSATKIQMNTFGISLAGNMPDFRYAGSINPINIPISLNMYFLFLSKNNNQKIKTQTNRYSGDFTDSFGQLQTTKLGINNNGYIPYVDYNRDYTPPPSLTLNHTKPSHTSLSNHLIIGTSTTAPSITSASIVGITTGSITNGTYSLTRHRHNERLENGLPTSMSSIPNGLINSEFIFTFPCCYQFSQFYLRNKFVALIFLNTFPSFYLVSRSK